MVDLPSLVQAAHDGGVVGNLARHFGLSQEQAKAAVDSLTPAIAHGLQNHIQSNKGLGQVATALNDPTHRQAYADLSAAESPQAAIAGAGLLDQIFGADGTGQVVSHVAAETGIDSGALTSLASTLASVVTGGVAKIMTESGFGDLLTQVEAANKPKPAAPAPQPRESEPLGLGYVVSDLFNPLFDPLFNWMFTKKAAAPAPAARQTKPVTPHPGLLQAGLGALGDLFTTAQPSEAMQGVLGQVVKR